MNRTKEQLADWYVVASNAYEAMEDIAELWTRIEGLEAERDAAAIREQEAWIQVRQAQAERDALLMDVTEATAANNCLQAEIIPLHKELSRQFAEIAAQMAERDALRAQVEVISNKYESLKQLQQLKAIERGQPK